MSSRIVLEDVRNSFNSTLSTSASLDTAANNMILVIGATIGFLVTLSAAIIIKIEVKYDYFGLIIVMTLAGIIVNIAAVIVFLLVRRIRDYRLFGHMLLDQYLQEGLLNLKKLNNLLDYDEPNLVKELIGEHLRAITRNQNLNHDKIKISDAGEYLFVSGVILLLASLAIQLYAVATGNISP